MRWLTIILLLIPALTWAEDTVVALNGVGFSITGGKLPAVHLQWDANIEPDLAGYKVYYACGSSEHPPLLGTGAQQGNSPIDVGNGTYAVISGLDTACGSYTWALTAYNTAGSESSYSSFVITHTDGTTETVSSLTGQGFTLGGGQIFSSTAAPNGQGFTLGAGQITELTTGNIIPLDGQGFALGSGPLDVIASSDLELTGQGFAIGSTAPVAGAKAIIPLTGLSVTFGGGELTTDSMFQPPRGQGFTLGSGVLISPNSTQTVVRVVKIGGGDIPITGNGINCGSQCQTVINHGDNLVLTANTGPFTANLIGWDGACISAERRTTCTVYANTAYRVAYEQSGVIEAKVYTGYFAPRACSTGRDTGHVLMFSGWQAAYDAIASGAAYNPIDCIAPEGDGSVVFDKPVTVVLVGGWLDFWPGRISADNPSVFTAPLIIRDGSVIIGDYMGGSVVVK